MIISLSDFKGGLELLEACQLDNTPPPLFIDFYGDTLPCETVGDLPLLAQGVIIRKLLSRDGMTIEGLYLDGANPKRVRDIKCKKMTEVFLG